MEPQEIFAGAKLGEQGDVEVCFSARAIKAKGETFLAPMMGLAPSSLRQLSAGAFEAQCGKCQRLSAPIDALGREHAWSELLKAGWTWYTSPLGVPSYASCLACLRASLS
jgi:hypothetical protein